MFYLPYAEYNNIEKRADYLHDGHPKFGANEERFEISHKKKRKMCASW